MSLFSQILMLNEKSFLVLSIFFLGLVWNKNLFMQMYLFIFFGEQYFSKGKNKQAGF